MFVVVRIGQGYLNGIDNTFVRVLASHQLTVKTAFHFCSTYRNALRHMRQRVGLVRRRIDGEGCFDDVDRRRCESLRERW